MSDRDVRRLELVVALCVGLVLTVLAFVVAVRPETAALGWAGGAICAGVACAVKPWCQWRRRR